jgi:hypothetical protein
MKNKIYDIFMPRCILIRYMFNRTLLFIANINFYIMDVTVIVK